MAIKSLIEEVKKDKKIAIFPEGRTSVTGSLSLNIRRLHDQVLGGATHEKRKDWYNFLRR